jgi:acetyl-CoA C-acetyltransferase
MDATRTPVIVGVGQVNDRAGDCEGLDPPGLMQAALRAADADAGGGWLGQVDSLSVVAQISFPELGDLSGPLAAALGASPRHAMQTRYPMGDGPVLLLDEAANRIAAGTSEVAAIVGGEALRTAAKRAQKASIDAVRTSATRAAKPYRQRYGLVAPTDIYPLYENACRAAWGQSLAEGQAESASIWSAFSQVAAANPDAWLRRPVTAEDVLAVSADNRPIAFPYTKLMVANSSVNQGAGFIVASLAKARAMGVVEDRIIYVGRGAGAREPGEVLARDGYTRSASMEATLRSVLAFNGAEASEFDAVELYSCFPCVPKMARRTIGWPLDKAMSVVGGLTFGGGPVGNYMSHAVGAMAGVLRAGGTTGLLFGNGGYATTSHAIVLSRDDRFARRQPEAFNVQAGADASRGAAPAVNETYEGAASIESYTVFYARSGAPASGVVVARTPTGERTLATVARDDADVITWLTSGAAEPVGAVGMIRAGEDGLMHWRMG